MKIFEGIYLVGSGRYGLSHPFDCNIYLLECAEELALIDAGAGVEIDSLLDNIRSDGLDPRMIKKVFLTHAHADHAGGSRKLKEALGCEILAPEGAGRLIEEGSDEELGLDIAKRSGLYAEDYRYPHCKVDRILRDGERVQVGDTELLAIRVAGHAEHAMCFLVEKGGHRILFTGDTLFFNGEIGLLNCPGSSLADYRRDIKKLANLGVDILLPGHKMFVLRNGQQHIDLAIQALSEISVPPHHNPTMGKVMKS